MKIDNELEKDFEIPDNYIVKVVPPEPWLAEMQLRWLYEQVFEIIKTNRLKQKKEVIQNGESTNSEREVCSNEY